jgi:hypothetical protein
MGAFDMLLGTSTLKSSAWKRRAAWAQATVNDVAHLAVLLAGVVGVSSCATGGPAQRSSAPLEARTAADFYPLEPGWKWAYDLEKDGQHMLAVYAVLERTPDTAIVQAGDERLVYAIGRDGVAQKDGATIGDFVLRNPIVLGAEWSVFAGKARIASVDERISLPSGDYEHCLIVETLRTDPTRLSRTTFAPGVGPISIEVQVQSQGRFVTTMRASLRGATKPGADPLAGAGAGRPRETPRARDGSGVARQALSPVGKVHLRSDRG